MKGVLQISLVSHLRGAIWDEKSTQCWRISQLIVLKYSRRHTEKKAIVIREVTLEFVVCSQMGKIFLHQFSIVEPLLRKLAFEIPVNM